VANHQKNSRRLGFTLTELLIVIGIFALLLGILLPTISLIRKNSQRTKCSACISYANQNDGHFPRTYYEAGVNLANSCQGGLGNTPASNPFSPVLGVSPVGVNNCAASLYLLLRDGFLTVDIFTCPANNQSQRLDPSTIQQYSNFPTPMHVYNSYSYASQFAATKAINGGWHYDLTTRPEYPLASDLNPGSDNGQNPIGVAYTAAPKQMALANSDNHQNAGQNVAYVDGHVEWATSPFCGPQVVGSPYRDNIFCNQNGTDSTTGIGGAIHGLPQGPTDVVMDPCEGAN
jgi:prepilin-type N-terminal cleavage/methylation domain-containing protein/prepilin-type processing-associated H-X9-DG protein